MAQSNYVQPLLNTPLDPFEQQRVAEERRYREAQLDKLRRNQMEDFQAQQAMRDESAQRRLQMQLDAQRRAERKRQKMQRGFAQEDLEAELERGRLQSQAMAGEIPRLNELASAKKNQLNDLQNSIFISDPVTGGDQNAANRTRTMIMNFAGQYDLPAPPPSVQTISDMLGYLGKQAVAQPNNENIQEALGRFETHVVNERTRLLKNDRNLNSQFSALQSELSSLEQRRTAILSKVRGGDMPYDQYGSGVLEPGTPYTRVEPLTAPESEAALDDIINPTIKPDSGNPEVNPEQASRDIANIYGTGNFSEAMEPMAEAFDYEGDSGTESAFDDMIQMASQTENPESTLNEVEDQLAVQYKAMRDSYQQEYDDSRNDMFNFGDMFFGDATEAQVDRQYEYGLNNYVDKLNKINQARQSMGLEPRTEATIGVEDDKGVVTRIASVGDVRFNTSTGLFEVGFKRDKTTMGEDIENLFGEPVMEESIKNSPYRSHVQGIRN